MKWIITFSKDNNTTKIETESAEKPSMQEAAELVLKTAQETERLEDEELIDVPRDHPEPTIALLEQHGIVITGIAQEG